MDSITLSEFGFPSQTNRFFLYDELVHHSIYSVNCLAGVIISEKVFEFSDYLSILVQG